MRPCLLGSGMIPEEGLTLQGEAHSGTGVKVVSQKQQAECRWIN